MDDDGHRSKHIRAPLGPSVVPFSILSIIRCLERNEPMKVLSPISVLMAAMCLSLGSLSLLAQGDKVTINLMPRPSQTVHFRMTQEMEIEVAFEGEAPP